MFPMAGVRLLRAGDHLADRDLRIRERESLTVLLDPRRRAPSGVVAAFLGRESADRQQDVAIALRAAHDGIADEARQLSKRRNERLADALTERILSALGRN